MESILFFSGDELSQIFEAGEFAMEPPLLLKSCALRYTRIVDDGPAKITNLKSTEFSTLTVENCGDRG